MSDAGSQRGLWRLLAPDITPHRRLGVAWLVAIGLSSAAALALPAVVGQVVDQGARLGVLFALAGVVIGLAATTAGRYYSACMFAESVASSLRQRVYTHLLSLDAPVFLKRAPGELVSRLIGDTDLIRIGIAQAGTAALRNVLTAVGATSMLILTSPRLAAVAAVAVPLVMAPIMLTARRLRSASRAHQDRQAQLQALASEVLGAVSTVQLLARGPYEADQFADARAASLHSARSRVRTQAGMAAAVIGGVGLAIALIVAVGADAVRAGELSGGQLGQFMLYTFIAGFSSVAIGEVLGEMQRMRGGLSRVQELMDIQPLIRAPERPRTLAQPIRGEVCFTGVRFAYPGRTEDALAGVDLTIKAGETVALVGPSGSGKSTVLNLLARFYDPDVGHVLIDGVDVRDLDPDALRQQLAVVPQHPVLFARSIADNVRYGRLDASPEDVDDALRAAIADGFVAVLPAATETIAGVRGADLSGGQQQRIAIARALVRSAPILLLDEATSALDAQSEQAMQLAFERSRRGRTTVVIAHRLSTVLSADRIVVMDQGRIVAAGTHTELMAENGLYAEFVQLQQGPSALRAA